MSLTNKQSQHVTHHDGLSLSLHFLNRNTSPLRLVFFRLQPTSHRPALKRQKPTTALSQSTVCNMSASTSYPFYQDLKAALILLITSSISSRNHFAHLTPSVTLGRTGCWCNYPFYPFPHDYTSCPHTTTGPRPSIVGPEAELRSCWHNREERRTSRAHKLFCFDLVATADRFMDWFMQPRAFLVGHMDIQDERQRGAILRSLQEYETRCPVNGSRGPAPEKFDVLCRLLVDLRREGITYEARMASNSWDAERVLAVLGWMRKGFDECLEELATAMGVVAERRLREERRFREEKMQRNAARRGDGRST
ncbi:hypothetical protein V8C37DRAFT_382334 [Trichoderma ceciliae]